MNTAAKASAAIATLTPRNSAARSEATKVEQSRAVAEVQAMVVVARANPRNEGQCRLSMQASCGQMGLAERAFFKYSRGGSPITGPSIHLATDLARCWGNVDYGLKELSRDDEAGMSEMQAYAWDLQTNARSATSFMSPHKRDKTGGPVALVDMRDIYENNANLGARRLREMILRILPPWYVEEAKDLCMKTLQSEDDRSPAERKKTMLEEFAKIGVSIARLEAKLGTKASLWTPVDMANLKVSYGSISRAEIGVDEEFPPVTSDAAAAAIGNVPPPVETPKPEAPPPAPAAAETVSDLLDKLPPPPATPPAARKPIDVALVEENLITQIRGLKTHAALNTFVKVTKADVLAQIKDEAPDAWQRIHDAADLRRETLG